ncbi:maltase 2-like [Liolophura sinensis]|uniref:maltase 2-like n=1 Tax=Liolophura sinensis TaxID=3198878 RepID=UPI0031585DAE
MAWLVKFQSENNKRRKRRVSVGPVCKDGAGLYHVSVQGALFIVFLAFCLGMIIRTDKLLLNTRSLFVGQNHKTAGQKALEWWKTSIIYQIYPRSFMDSIGDGIGDLKGITTKLDYLKDLNVGVIWLSPFFESPMADFGYDLSNQTRVDPIFGTMEDFEILLKTAHAKGMKVILDYIPNHTSDQHPWFIESRKGNSSNPYYDYYVWKDGVVNINKTRSPPNNWRSFFSGSAWQFDENREQYYFHQYLPQQPDLNWRNPKVREEMEGVMRFWLDKGVDGFRVDAIQTLFEVEDVSLNEPRSFKPNVTEEEHDYVRHIYTQNQDETHDVIRSWRQLLEEYELKDGKKRFMVVEVYDEDISQVIKFYQSGADMAFYFDLLFLNRTCGGKCIQAIVNKLLDHLPEGKWPNFVLGNHDNPRIASKMGLEFVNALNTLLLLLPGTPTTYYGEEIGLENIELSYDDTQDPFGRFYGPERYREVSRDPVRSPMQWNHSYQSGFTTASKPWLPIHPMYTVLNVESQSRAKSPSHLKLYRQLAVLREEAAFELGSFEYVLVNDNIFSFVRRVDGQPAYFVAINFGHSVAMEDFRSGADATEGEVVFTTGNFQHHIYEVGQELELENIVLNPGQGIVMRLKNPGLR